MVDVVGTLESGRPLTQAILEGGAGNFSPLEVSKAVVGFAQDNAELFLQHMQQLGAA